MKAKLFSILLLVFLISSCEKYDEDVMEIAGVYEAHVTGVAGPFSMVISADYGNSIKIDAPWLKDTWALIQADVRDKEDYSKRINIYSQKFDGNKRIYGEGVFQNYTLQIDYTIEDGNDLYHYTLVGTKL